MIITLAVLPYIPCWVRVPICCVLVPWWRSHEHGGHHDRQTVGGSLTTPSQSLGLHTQLQHELNNDYCQTPNISCSLVGNKLFDHSDVVGASPVDAAPTTSSFSNTWLQWIGQRQLQDETKIIYVFNIGSGNGLLPDSTKLLPEPMLIDHQWSPETLILGQFI